MSHRIHRLGGLVIAGLLACQGDTRTAGDDPGPGGMADHHVHLLSPRLIADWKSLGVPFSRPDSVYRNPDGLLAGPEPVLARALLVPMAHLYGREEFRSALGISLDQEAIRARAENDWVAAEAARWPGRAVAFCSVNHRRPWAREEMERCRLELRSPGLKLHLAAAGTDLTDPVQLAELEDIAGWTARQGMTLLLHFDPQRRGLELGDVERFLATVLGPHPGLEVIVAHLGGSGGYREWTRGVLGTFAAWLAARPGQRVWFDLSAALLAEESEGVPASTEAEGLALGQDMRRIGLDRFVFGTDYPVFRPGAYRDLLAARTGLTPRELEVVLAQVVPVLRP